MAVNIDGNGLIALGGTSSTQGRLRLAEDTDNGTNYIELTAPASVASNRTITLPDNTGTMLTSASSITASQLPAGSVLQVVQTQKTDQFSTSSASLVDITGFSVTITPTSATSNILIMVTATIGPAADNFAPASLVRNSTLIAQPTTASTYQATLNSYPGDDGGNAQSAYVITWLDSPATTSATTYKLQMYTTGGTAYFNSRPALQNGTTVSSITAMEIAA